MFDGGMTLLWLAAMLIWVFVYFLRMWLGSLKEARTTEDVATTRIRAAAQGYVELQGRARPLDEGPLTSPLLGLPAVWWRCTFRKVGEKGGPVEERASTKRFYIEDATGRCLVDWAGAEITPSSTRAWYGANTGAPNAAELSSTLMQGYHCTEAVLSPGARIYVRGEFRTLRVGAQPLDFMRGKLAAWQSDEKKRAILDVDRDGKLSETELEAARRAALLEAKREAGTSGGSADVVCKPADGRPFVISAAPQHVYARGHRRGAVAGLAGTVITGLMLLALIALVVVP